MNNSTVTTVIKALFNCLYHDIKALKVLNTL